MILVEMQNNTTTKPTNKTNMKKKELEIAITTYTVAYKKGYTQCQEDMADKKYTEEDIIKAIAYGQTTKQIDYHKDFINSLNKQD